MNESAVLLAEWNVAIRIMAREGTAPEARRAAAVLVLALAPSDHAALCALHAAAEWPPPPPEFIFERLLDEARMAVHGADRIPTC